MQREFFDNNQCVAIEKKINELVDDGNAGLFKKCTVDITPLRSKYFFGYGYTYGSGMGSEKVYPDGEIDPIPKWITEMIIEPLEEKGIVKKNWINSAVVNDYKPGGCISSHIDPPHIFERPIISISFLSNCQLSFGCKFRYKPMRVSKPVHSVPLKRGYLTSIDRFAANEITHCIRPCDVVSRRAVVILRRVRDDAPRVSSMELQLSSTQHTNEYHSEAQKRTKRLRSRSMSPRTKRKLSPLKHQQSESISAIRGNVKSQKQQKTSTIISTENKTDKQEKAVKHHHHHHNHNSHSNKSNEDEKKTARKSTVDDNKLSTNDNKTITTIYTTNLLKKKRKFKSFI
ncbi:unnamed protein product [Didymodactylos carnosus]|uniref:RNA demethylase ALKBH5 n=1 Tax=Didymodactylos carnosus TaxID=1234261 RepID=A0A814UTM7_9BILA|nr:unnamed protein product [Didymodactylos carnosus]CAF1179121.1 unnamed protein product [Didymodactylos carnosus]CAF3687607.1 unnamed protein product [Didymodactylos carnosus]CAF3943350.1 unnamed protein product [Didymodactylos carnosus]